MTGPPPGGSPFERVEPPAELVPKDPRFGVGPSRVPPRHMEALLARGAGYMGTSHRGAPLVDEVRSLKANLRGFFGLPDGHEVVLGVGGATTLFDMVGLGMVRRGSLHHVCGEFSDKWRRAHGRVPWISTRAAEAPPGEGVDPAPPGDGEDLLALTLNETSTGAMLDRLPAPGGDALVCVDATSGAGQCPCDVAATDVFFFSPQKVLASEGGLFVCFLSPKARERIREVAGDGGRFVPASMDWTACLEASAKNQTCATPALATIFLMNRQLEAMIASGGLGRAQEAAREKARLVYGWAESKPYLSPFVREERHRSLSVCAIDVDPRHDVRALLSVLARRGHARDLGAYRKLGRNQVRIAIFHAVPAEDLERLTGLLSFMIENADAPRARPGSPPGTPS